jgi:hypothetical protein
MKHGFKKFLLFISFTAISVFAQEIIVYSGETKIIENKVFENYSGDFVIKNYGVLVIKNCTFKNNALGSKNNQAIFPSEKTVATVINYGDLSVVNCKFINNFSWNTALTSIFVPQAAAGAIANFAETDLSNNTFENNSYQKGQFTIIRNQAIQQISYIGNDTIFNLGNIRNLESENAENIETDLKLDVVLMQNPVKDKARILVKTNKTINVKIVISDAANNMVLSVQRQIQNDQVIEWNLTNNAGNKVASGAYAARVEIGVNGKTLLNKAFMIGVKR